MSRAPRPSAPLRLVVKRVSNGEVGWRGGGSWFDTLACGHTVRAKRSAGAPIHRRCAECAKAQS